MTGAVWRESPVVKLQLGKPGFKTVQLTLHRFRSQKPRRRMNRGSDSNVVPLQMFMRKAKESQLHGQAPHSQRPEAQLAHLESRGRNTNMGCSFGVLPTRHLVSSPNVERKTGSLHSERGGKQSRENARVLHYL